MTVTRPANQNAHNGSTQRRGSNKGRQRRPDLRKVYRRSKPEINLSEQEFRCLLLQGGKRINIDRIVDSVEWRWEQGDPTLQGTLVVHASRAPTAVRLRGGDQIKLDCRWGPHGTWREVFRMRLSEPDGGGLQLSEEIQTWDLADDGHLLQQSRDNWHYVKTKKGGHPRGWRCDQVARDIAHRYRIPMGKIAKGKHYITDLSMHSASPTQVLQRVYAIERRHSGRRFVIQWHGGKLNVLPLRRNPLLNILGPLIEDATIGREPRHTGYATAVTVRASLKRKGTSKRKKLVYHYQDQAAIKRWGFVHRQLGGHEVKTEDDARQKAKRYIARHSRRKRTITGLTHMGIAFLRRGDAVQVRLPAWGFKGRQSFCFVSAGSWVLSSGDFTMTLDLTFDDPYVSDKDKRKTKDKKTREDKRHAG